jgi:hypothetical protein
VAYLVALSYGLFILIHQLVSAAAANGMGDAMFVHHVISEEFFCAEEFAAPRANYLYIHFHVLPLLRLARKNLDQILRFDIKFT